MLRTCCCSCVLLTSSGYIVIVLQRAVAVIRQEVCGQYIENPIYPSHITHPAQSGEPESDYERPVFDPFNHFNHNHLLNQGLSLCILRHLTSESLSTRNPSFLDFLAERYIGNGEVSFLLKHMN